MNRNRFRTMTLVAGAFAVALAGAACGDRHRTAEDELGTVGTSGYEIGQERQVTLSGCLQRGDDSEFMLSGANEAPAPVGTAGEAGEPGGVARQQEIAAARTYRLSGDTGELDTLVGQQVRVSGTIADRGDIGSGTAGTAGEEQERPEEGDLAEVDVASVESIAETCGTGAGR